MISVYLLLDFSKNKRYLKSFIYDKSWFRWYKLRKMLKVPIK